MAVYWQSLSEGQRVVAIDRLFESVKGKTGAAALNSKRVREYVVLFSHKGKLDGFDQYERSLLDRAIEIGGLLFGTPPPKTVSPAKDETEAGVAGPADGREDRTYAPAMTPEAENTPTEKPSWPPTATPEPEVYDESLAGIDQEGSAAYSALMEEYARKRAELERRLTSGDLEGAARLKYGLLPEIERRIDKAIPDTVPKGRWTDEEKERHRRNREFDEMLREGMTTHAAQQLSAIEFREGTRRIERATYEGTRRIEQAIRARPPTAPTIVVPRNDEYVPFLPGMSPGARSVYEICFALAVFFVIIGSLSGILPFIPVNPMAVEHLLFLAVGLAAVGLVWLVIFAGRARSVS